jgi:rhodanese-related sulfurtransferase
MNTSPGNLALEIDVRSVKALLDQGEPLLLVDCREADEYEFVRLNEATLIPMGQIPARISELEGHRQGRIIVHCHFGGRSLQVVQWLRGQGFTQAQNMTGGIDAWSVEIDPSLPRY